LRPTCPKQGIVKNFKTKENSKKYQISNPQRDCDVVGGFRSSKHLFKL